MTRRTERRTTQTVTATVGLIAGDRHLTHLTQQAALALGVELHVLAAPRAGNAGDTSAGYRHDCHADLTDLIAFATRCDVVTFASSTISPSHLDVLLAAGVTLRPSPQAAELAGDSATARRILHDCGFDVAPIPTDTASDTVTANCSMPRHDNTIRRGCPPGSLWIGELVVVIARRPSGHRVAYPGLETVNADRRHLGPPKSTPTPPLTAERAAATAIAIAIADGIDATGIIAVEFLLAFDGRPFVDNILLGPHPHRNPAITSEYENHLRAILDWPLGATTIGTPTP